MQFVIEKASLSDAKKVNDLLTKLIIDEKSMMKILIKIVLLNRFMKKFMMMKMRAC